MSTLYCVKSALNNVVDNYNDVSLLPSHIPLNVLHNFLGGEFFSFPDFAAKLYAVHFLNIILAQEHKF